jgi:hypothetical protein
VWVSITRLTLKWDGLRARTVGVDTKEFASNCHKSSTRRLSSGKKRKEDETDDDNMKQISSKKKQPHAVQKQ